MLSFPVRIRDLVHGFVHLTRLEETTIDHELFQRLRRIAQNDLASHVYPSLNVTRFEHSLGTLCVAGKMAENLKNTPSGLYDAYLKACGLDDDGLQQSIRLYALLHDIGHMPLSHVFETAFGDFVTENRSGDEEQIVIEEIERWTDTKGYSKIHEAYGAKFSEKIIEDAKVEEPIKSTVLRLLTEKQIPREDPLIVIKKMIDSDIDADRIDSTARDGLLAGGEFGRYDIARLTTAPRVIENGSTWELAYSHKAIGPIETLLLERCRTHTWIHFHHRAVASKAAARIVIATLIKNNIINPDSFSTTNLKNLIFYDDFWLWSLIRSHELGSEPYDSARKALLTRDKKRAVPLWKNRFEYKDAQQMLYDKARRREIKVNELNREYEKTLYDSRLLSHFNPKS